MMVVLSGFVCPPKYEVRVPCLFHSPACLVAQVACTCDRFIVCVCVLYGFWVGWFACFISCVEVYVVVRSARTRLRPCIWSIGNTHAVAAMYSIGSGSMSSVSAVLTKETLFTPTVIFIRFFNRVKLDAYPINVSIALKQCERLCA